MIKRLRLLLLIAAYLLMQTVSLAHAAEHAFHEADAGCDVYFAAKNSGHGLVDSGSPPAEIFIAAQDCGKPAQSCQTHTARCFSARASPSTP